MINFGASDYKYGYTCENTKHPLNAGCFWFILDKMTNIYHNYFFYGHSKNNIYNYNQALKVGLNY